MSIFVYTIRAKVWVYTGVAAWYFISIPKKESADIKKNFSNKKRGWGSLPVRVSCGETIWKTSIFPDTKSASYLLPLKASVRKKENIFKNEEVVLKIEILV